MVYILLLLMISPGLAIIGENAILDQPIVNCTDNAIIVTIRTMGPFRGSMYVRGHHEEEHCRQIYYSNDMNVATFVVQHSTCGVRRRRTLQPHGVIQEATFVATLHHEFVTKADRAFHVKCFYEHADKVLHANMEVGAMPTETIERSTTILPSCRYSIREGNLDGPSVRATTVGTVLVHRWECDNPQFGMLVKSCFVKDGVRAVPIIDERGCPVPPTWTSTPTRIIYDTSLSIAYLTFAAFAFPDREKWQVECQINVCSKQDNECEPITPPNCPNYSSSRYVPNSIVNPEIAPTQVVAFQGILRANPIGDGVLSVDGNAVPIGINDNRIPMGTMQSPNEFEHPWRREQNSIMEEDTTMEQHNETHVETTTAQWEIPAIPDHLLYQRDSPIETIFIKSSTPAPINDFDEGLSARERRLADQVVDVESEEVFVQSLDEPTFSKAFQSKKGAVVEKQEELTCLNNVALWTSVSVFAVTTMLSFIFIISLWKNLFKTCMPRMDPLEELSVRSMGSCQELNPHNPIYTRRLGHPSYVIPVRLQ